jgi:hypothetical protein
MSKLEERVDEAVDQVISLHEEHHPETVATLEQRIALVTKYRELFTRLLKRGP